MKHSFSKAVAFFALMGLLGSPLAHAQSDAVKAAREAVIENLSDIKDVQSAALSPEEKAEKERVLKKTAFSNLLSLSILETEDVLSNLEGLALEGQHRVFVPLRKELTANLKEYKKYFEALREVLAATETIGDIRGLAGQFEEKRESSYNVDVRKAVEMLVTLHVEEILVKAHDRSEKLTTAVRRAKSTKAETLLRTNLLREAATHLSRARGTALLAREKLSAYLLPRTEEQAPLTKTSEAEQAIMEKVVPEPTISELADQSLEETREAYKNFIELTDSLNRKSSR
jgi:hypothetical protein